MAKKKEIVLNKDYDSTFDDILLDGGLEGKISRDEIKYIPISKLVSFKNHPFKVLDDDKMAELVESIKDNGIMAPVIVRPHENAYELISGHRRTHAAVLAGLNEVPAVIRELSDDEATVLMVDANIQREEILPSERARSLKMKIDSLNNLMKYGMRKGDRSRDIAGRDAGISGRQVQKYLSLNNLLPELMDMLDDKKIIISLAAEIAGLRPEVQYWVYEHVSIGGPIKADVIAKLKELDEENALNQDVADYVLNKDVFRDKPRKVVLSDKKLSEYFPSYYSQEDIEGVIFKLLDYWKDNRREEDKADE
ncbi:MAG: ParB/RepB/Spo0J family partition protein [Lachnospiraceae bacterium]|nr:ParB/RepB/Spo0J family partition protein [Lachnospiraceae bacterium]